MPPRGNTILPLFHEVEYDAITHRARKQKRCLAVLTSPKPQAKSIRRVLGQAAKVRQQLHDSGVDQLPLFASNNPLHISGMLYAIVCSNVRTVYVGQTINTAWDRFTQPQSKHVTIAMIYLSTSLGQTRCLQKCCLSTGAILDQ